VLKRRILWNYIRMELQSCIFFEMICLATCLCGKYSNLKATFTGLHRSLAKQDDLTKILVWNNFVVTKSFIMAYRESLIFKCLRISLLQNPTPQSSTKHPTAAWDANLAVKKYSFLQEMSHFCVYNLLVLHLHDRFLPVIFWDTLKPHSYGKWKFRFPLSKYNPVIRRII
jgi:hypothetical protein